ncbi:hypothetical protein H3V20_08075 [Campylobacter jejuni]|nr:hypothetical protein H3V20_08075 [Campylobacter jejuni]
MSIFSINDNSNYNSILSQAKANKESKENSKISFASIGYGGALFDNQFNQAKANGWKASNQSIDSYVNSIMDRLNNLIGQTRV